MLFSFSISETDIASTSDSIDAEIVRYLAEPLTTFEKNPLKQWYLWREKFPKISRIAPAVLVVPASNAASERGFSRAGNFARKNRARLNPEILDAQCIVASSLIK